MGKVVYFGEHVPGLCLEGTDIEILYRIEGGDLVLQVNKGPVQVFRVRLADAFMEMTDDELAAFNGVAPDFVFRIGDSRERLWLLAQGLGLDEAQLVALKAKLLG